MGEVRTALWIVRRYLLSRSHGYATFINWVSFVGLVLGVMILTVVLGIMNGFDREMTGRILSAVPHGFFEFDGDPPIEDLERIEGVGSVTRLFQGEAMATRYGGVAFVGLAAVDEAGARAMPRVLSEQALEKLFASRGNIVLGATLARDLRLSVGDSVRLVFPVPTTVGVRPQIELFTLAAIFELKAQPDAVLGIVQRQAIVDRGLANAGLDGWRLQLADPLDAPQLAEPIRAVLGPATNMRFWTDDYGEFFRAVRIEKAIMFALLALIVAVASLNIVSGQAMLVNDKRGDIAMLTTMGASRRLVVGVFFLQGFAVAFLGVAAGLILGIGVAANAHAVVSFFEGLVGASVTDGTYFDRIHSHLVVPDLLAIVGVALGLSVVAVLRPAFKAAAENPVEALHA